MKAGREVYFLIIWLFFIAMKQRKGNKFSGAVIKTNAPHPSELENGIAIRINERFPKLKSTQEKYPLCQIFSKVIPSSDNMDTLDACLQPLKAFS